jgi:hypothetical protein
MKLAAQAVNALQNLQNLKTHWTADADLFARALKVVTETLKIFHPHQLTATDVVVGSTQMGTPVLKIVREVQAADPSRPLNNTESH